MSRCGSGLSGESLTEAGHFWVGIDISQHMLGEKALLSSLPVGLLSLSHFMCAHSCSEGEGG